MEIALRGVVTGLIFHFAAGFIIASMWRLTSARVAWIAKRHQDPNPSDAFWEVMTWPLYLVLLFALLIKSLVDLILEIGSCVPQSFKKWKGEWMKRKEMRIRKKTAQMIPKNRLDDHHMLAGECEALDLFRKRNKS